MIRLYLRKGVKADYSLAIAMRDGLETALAKTRILSGRHCKDGCDECPQYANCKKEFDALRYCVGYIEAEEYRMYEKEFGHD